jgi:hypothetical protein
VAGAFSLLQFIANQLLGPFLLRDMGQLMPGDLAEKFDMAKGSTTTCWRSSGISQFSSIWFLISQLISMVKLSTVVNG